MAIRVSLADFKEIEPLREQYRAEAGCQIVRDSILARGLADPFVIRNDGETLGYVGVWTSHFPGRLMEFFMAPGHRARARDCFDAALRQTGALAVEAQTNLPLQHDMLLRYVARPTVEHILFGEGPTRHLRRPGLLFRSRLPGDAGPDGEWVVLSRGKVVGAGGLMHHYNPPFADLYMEVVPSARGQGVGSFIVEQLCRVCRESGKIPAARCDPDNRASRSTLLRGGLVEVGEMVAGDVKRHGEEARELWHP